MSRRVSFSLIYFALITFVVYPFLRYNNLDIWDTSSHYQAIWFVKNFLLPHYTGWNPFAFAGFPQGLLYPPLFHYLGGLLAVIFNVQVALKLLVVVPILLFPIVIYFFCKAYSSLSKTELAIMVVFYTFAFVLFGEIIGGSLLATFKNGMVVNNFALLFFFLFLTALKLKKTFLSILLLAVILLTHLPTAVASLIAFGALVILERSKVKFYLVVGFFSFCITAFWTIPLLVFGSETSFDFLNGVSFSTVFGLVSFLLILCFINKLERHRFTHITFICFSIVLVCIISLIVKFPVWHVYRLMSYAYWLVPYLLFFCIRAYGLKTDSKFLVSISVLFVLCVVSFVLRPISYFPFTVIVPTLPTDKRVIVNYVVPAPQNMPHYLNDQLPIVSNNVPALGLFMEESRNSFYLMQFLYRMSNKNFIWGVSPSDFMKHALQQIDTENIAKLFNIQYVFETQNYAAAVQNKENIVGFIPNPSGSFNDTSSALVLKELPNSGNLVEPITDFTLVKATNLQQWKAHVDEWFFTYPLPKSLLIDTDNSEISSTPDTYEISNITTSRTMDTISFYSNASKPSLVLIKVSYFPKWHAYSNGVELPVYRVSPNLMAVYGTGAITLNYSDFSWEVALRIFSLAGFVVLVITSFLLRYKLMLSKKTY